MKRHSTFLIPLFAAILLLPSINALAQQKLSVVTSLPDLADIAGEIGGSHVSTFAIASGYQNPHFVDPKPSYITRLARADVFVTVGLDLETGWVPPLLGSSRNSDIMPGGAGYVDASMGVPLLQVPSSVSRDQGDIHVYGNPHYWLDPVRGKIIARNIFGALVRIQPENRADFQANLDRFDQRIDDLVASLAEAKVRLEGKKVIAYHNEWPYLEEFLGFHIVDFLEPKPGIPPTASQLAKIITTMESQNIDLIITSPYFKTDNADLVARRVGAKVVVLATSVEAFPGIDSYFDLFEYNVNLLLDATASRP